MQNKNPLRSLFPVIIIFIVSGAVIFLLKTALVKIGFNITVLSMGNLVLFVATAGSFILFQKALGNNNVHYFMRMFYAALFMKMFICVVAVVVYILIARSEVNKLAIYGCAGLYCLYTFAEIKILMRLSRRQKNA